MTAGSRVAIAVSAALALGFVALPSDAGISFKGGKVRVSCGDCKKLEREVIRPVVQDVKRETRNLGESLEEAVRESGRFVNRESVVIQNALETAGYSLLHGNPLEAGYLLQREYINGSTDNTMKTLQQSSVLRGGAQILAGAAGGMLGGPAGASAGAGLFSGTYVYKTTGDKDAAFKAAVVTAGSSALTGALESTPPTGAEEIAARAVANGHVSGSARTIMGGSYEDGFLLGAAGSVANSMYRMKTESAPDGAPSKGWPYSKEPNADTKSFDYSRPHTGMTNAAKAPQSFKDMNWADFNTEHSPYLLGASKVPGINAGSVFHDIWATQQSFTFPLLQVTIPPAFVLTYMALHAPENSRLLDSSVEAAKEK